MLFLNFKTFILKSVKANFVSKCFIFFNIKFKKKISKQIKYQKIDISLKIDSKI